MSISLLFLTIAILFGIASAQPIPVKGTVVDSSGVGIGSVLVSVVDSTTIVGFSFTDEAGKFNIELSQAATSKRNLKLVARRLGCQEISQVISLFKENIVLRISCSSLVLDEIEITDTKPPISYSGDTTRFNVDFFRSPTDRGVTDVIRRLPGFEVKDNGKISFQGKTVQDVLIDNVNILGSAYERTLSSVPAAAVGGIEAIENYEEDYVIQGLYATNDAVGVNISLTPDAKLKPTGNSELLFSPPESYKADLNVLSTGGRHKQIVSFDGNSVGRQQLEAASFNLDDGNSLTQLASPTKTRYGLGYSTNVIPNQLTTFGNRLSGAINTAGKLSKVWGYELSPSFTHTNSDFFTNGSQTLFLDSAYTFNTRQQRNIIQNTFAATSRLVGRLNSHNRITLAISASSQTMSYADSLVLAQDANQGSFATLPFEISAFATYSYRYRNNSALRVTVGGRLYDGIDRSNVLAIRKLISQRIQTQDNNAVSRIEWFINKTNRLTAVYNYSDAKQFLSRADTSQPLTSWSQHLLKIGYNYNYTSKKLSLDVEPSVTLFGAASQSQNLTLSDNTFPTPSVRLVLKPTSRISINTSFSRSIQSPSIDRVRLISAITGIFSSDAGLDPVGVTSVLSASGTFKYLNQGKQIELRNTVTAQREGNVTLTRPIIDYPLNLSQQFQSGQTAYTFRNYFYSHFYLSPLSSLLKLSYQYSRNVSPIGYESRVQTFNVVNNRIKAGMYSIVTKHIKSELNTEINFSSVGASNITQYLASVKADASFSKITCNVDYTAYKFAENSDLFHRFHIVFGWSLNKAVKLKVEADNLIGNTVFATASVDAAVNYSQSMPVRGRLVLIGAEVSF
jgi:hypothetical protein